MEKWEQSINTAVNRAMPEAIEERIQRTLHELPRKKYKLGLRYAVPAAVLAIIVLFGATAISPVIAEKLSTVPLIGSIFEKVGNIGQLKVSEQGLVSSLNQQLIVNGESVTFTHILYDGSSIHLGYLRQSADIANFSSGITILIDGQQLTDYYGGNAGRGIEDGAFAGIWTIQLEQQLPDTFVLELISQDMEQGVQFPVTVQGEQQTYLLKETRKWREQTLIYDNIAFYPTSTVLSVHGPLGYSIQYQIFDDQGRVLQPFMTGEKTAADDELGVSQFIYEPVDTIPQTLTFRPYFGNGFAQGSSKERWTGERFELSQGEAGSIWVEAITQQETQYTITYEVMGELTYERAYFVWLENQDGERYTMITTPRRVEGMVNQYEATFAATSAEDEVIVVTQHFQPLDYVEGMELTIELDK